MTGERSDPLPHPAHELNERSSPRWSRRIALFFGAGAAYFLLMEHRAHVIQALPWIIVLLCPLMHVFMHRAHRIHRSDEGEGSNTHGSQGHLR